MPIGFTVTTYVPTNIGENTCDVSSRVEVIFRTDKMARSFAAIF